MNRVVNVHYPETGYAFTVSYGAGAGNNDVTLTYRAALKGAMLLIR